MDKIIINTHSFVDIITNSSTELFCYVEGKTKKQIEAIIKAVVDEFGCEAVDFYVDECDEIWNEESGEDIQVDNTFAVGWQYETHQPPCKLMIKRLKEIFGGTNAKYSRYYT